MVIRRFSTAESGFSLTSGHVGFAVDKVAMAQGFLSTSTFLASTHSADCSTIIVVITMFIYHPGLVQQAKRRAKYQVHSVSPYLQKRQI
jgi:hypothetical protein